MKNFGVAMHHVVIVGCGTIGLPIAVALAQRGAEIVGVDSDRVVVDRLSRGIAHTEEQDLSAALRSALADGRLRFATTIPASVEKTAFVVAVPTPVSEHENLRREPIERAIEAVQAAAGDGDLIIIRSTVPIGVTRQLASHAPAAGGCASFACCPDRSVAGRSFADQFTVPNIVGGLDPQATRAACDLFARLGQVRVVSSVEAAEALKLFSNVQRDTLFALSNQFALICEAANLDFRELLDAGSLNYSRFSLPRSGPVGGPCLPKDLFLLAEFADASGVDISLLRQARRVNHGLVDSLSERICREVDRLGARPVVVSILGMAFKGSPPVRDQRGSFGCALLASLRRKRPTIDLRDWDPVTDPGLTSRSAAVRNADIIVLANDHPALADLEPLAEARPGALVFDMCGLVKVGVNIPARLIVLPFGSGRVRFV